MISLVLLSLALAADEPATTEPSAARAAEPESESAAAPPKAPEVFSPHLEIGMRLHGRLAFRDTPPTTAFELVRARALLELVPLPWLTGSLDVDVAEVPILKDAYVELAPWAQVRVRVGQMKKPFSRINRISSGKLPLASRGLVNKRFVGDLGFAGRDLGVALQGSLGPATLVLGVFNGTGNAPEIDSGKDAAARLAVELDKALELGASGSLVVHNPDSTQRAAVQALAAGLDLRLRLGAFDVMGEALFGQEPTAGSRRQHLGAVVYALLHTPRLFGVSLRPIVKVELLDDDTRGGHDEVWALMGGVNLDVKAPVRLFMQLQRTLPGPRSTVPEEWIGWLQLAVDLKHELSLPTVSGLD